MVERMDALPDRVDVVERKLDNLTASVDRRFDDVDKRFEDVDKRFDAVDKRFEDVDKRFDAVDKRFEDVDKRFDEVSEAIAEQRRYTEFAFERLRAEMASGLEHVDRRLTLEFGRLERKVDQIIDAVLPGAAFSRPPRTRKR